ncbi:MAG: hypothetical protein HQM12_13290 [SAR324 cluster bacterium]|nr:hypothetical protein [SAR324 cluster bacterium]
MMKALGPYTFWALLLLLFSFFLVRPYHLQQTGLMYTGDDESYFAHATSLVFLKFPDYKSESFSSGNGTPMHSIGPGLMAAPIVFLFSQIDRLTGSDIIHRRSRDNIYPSWSLFGFFISTYFYFCMACLLAYKGIRYWYSGKIALISVATLFILQFFPLYVFRRPVFSHIYEMFLQTVFVYFLLRDKKTGYLDNPSYGLLIFIGLLNGLITLVRYNNVIFSLIWPSILLMRKNQAGSIKNLSIVYAVTTVLIICFKLLPMMLYSGEQYSSIIMVALTQIYSWDTYLLRVVHILFGIDWGLIFTVPFILLAMFYIGYIPDTTRKYFYILFVPILVNLYVVIMWGTQGAWYGYRYLIASLTPLMILSMGEAITQLQRKIGEKYFMVAVVVISMVPVLSMLSFEGNNTNLTLHIIEDYFKEMGFAKGEWGNKTYHWEIVTSIINDPFSYVKTLFKAGPAYLVYLIAQGLDMKQKLPEELLLRYPEFRIDILIKMIVVYLFPFIFFSMASYLEKLTVFTTSRFQND